MSDLSAADYFDLTRVSEPRLSPDGEQVAYVETVATDETTEQATIHLVAADGSDDPRQFTVSEGVDSQPRWSPSGDRLAFVSTRGADDDRPQLWVLPTDGGEARQVTDVVGGVSTPEWSPDGERIAFVQRVSDADREAERDREVPAEYEPEPPDPRVIDRTVYRTAQQYFDGKRPQVYCLDVASESVSAVTTADFDHASPTFGDDRTLYYARSVGADPDDSLAYEIRARDLDAETDELVHETTGWAHLEARGEQVAFVYAPEERTTLRPTEPRVFDRAAGEVREPMAGVDRTLAHDVLPRLGPDGALYVGTPDEGTIAVWRAPIDGEPERLVADGHVSGMDVGGGTVALTQSQADHPGDVFVADSEGARRLTEVNADLLAERSLPEVESLTIDGPEGGIDGWLLTPEGEGPHPLVVEVHGGPHVMWSAAGSVWHEFRTLVSRGYAVFWSNPRGSSGYGEAFAAAIERDWGAVTSADVLAGVETVTARETIDGDSVFLTGGSFGGYMTAWLVGHSDRFTAAVAQRGVYDLTSFYGSTDGAYKLVEGDWGTTPWEEPEFLWEHSPASAAPEIETPTLVLHSENDYRVPVGGAELLYRGLRLNGTDTRLVRYPEEGHELSRSGQPDRVVDRIERIARWFDGYSPHHDAPRALDRDRDDGLTAGEKDSEAADGEDGRESDESQSNENASEA